jgi:DNA-binding transcriptional ArsR family regulator
LTCDHLVTYCRRIDTDDDDDVFKALADGGRRQLLDALFVRDGQTLGELCDVLPTITRFRFGVMKHLGVLEGAGLVVTEKVGRSKLHYLNPVPIQEIQQRWISKYAAPTVAAMVGLRHQLEQPTA